MIFDEMKRVIQIRQRKANRIIEKITKNIDEMGTAFLNIEKRAKNELLSDLSHYGSFSTLFDKHTKLANETNELRIQLEGLLIEINDLEYLLTK